jgi:integrase
MPKLSRSIPSYRKHRSSGQAVVTFSGHDYYHGTKASRIEYDRLIGEWLRHGRQLPNDSDDRLRLSVVEVIVAYLHFAHSYYRKDERPTSESKAIIYALRFFKQLYGRKSVEEFGPIALQVCMQHMVDHGLSRGVINQHAGRIKRMFKWGVAQELIPATIYHALSSVPGLQKGRTDARETPPVRTIDDAIVDATAAWLPEVVADMVAVQRHSGMRPAEVCLLRPMDIDHSDDVWVFKPESHKTEHHDRERVIFLGPKAQAVLLKYLARDVAAYCFRPCDSEAKRRTAQHSARTVPVTCGNRPGTNRKASPKRYPGDKYDTGSYRRAIHRGAR